MLVFIADLSKLAKPLCKLLEKDVIFSFDKSCMTTFEEIKNKLIEAPIVVGPTWNKPFEIICDASDFAVGVVLGQRREKMFRPIYYMDYSRTLIDMCKAVTDVSELVLNLEEMKCY